MLKRHANACNIDLYFKLIVLMWFFVSDSTRKANLESSPLLSFCLSKSFQRIDTLFSLQFPLKYVVNWGFKVLTALWKIVSAQCWFGWKAQSLLPGISNKLSVKPQQCACSHRPDPGGVGIVSPHPILVWVWGLGGICFVFLNWSMKSCHSLLISHSRFQRENTVFTVPL